MLGIPVSIGVIYMIYKRVSLITDTWFSPDEYERSMPKLKFWMRSIALVCLLLALLGPHWKTSTDTDIVSSREIYFLLDVSASMNAQDVKPSRLEKAKRVLRELMRELPGDKVGLILFTEQAYVQCPLTRDHQALSLFLDMAQTYQFTQTGTQFRSALAVAMDRFQQASESSQVGRAVVLVSDGEDFGDTYASLIDRLRQSSISVFTVGVGTYEGAPIPHFVHDKKQGYKRYEDGTMAISRLIDEDLQILSDEFGTEYLHFGTGSGFESIQRLKDDLYANTTSPLESSLEDVRHNSFQAFVFISVILLFMSLFLMPIRRI